MTCLGHFSTFNSFRECSGPQKSTHAAAQLWVFFPTMLSLFFILSARIR
uniref:Uncharacterized protein n=1 Tax=Arundo donax TaxID=35708 RepID=A0A0A9DF82_ARUDO